MSMVFRSEYGATPMLLASWSDFGFELDFGVMMGMDTISVPDHVVQTSVSIEQKPCLTSSTLVLCAS